MGDKIKMRTLVTGGSGYLGSVLVTRLGERHDVTVLDLREPSNREVEWIKEDIRNNGRLENIAEDFDSVIHLAAVVGDAACNKDPNLAVETNYLATKALAKVCKKNGTQILFASTCSVYGATGLKYKENDDPQPFSLYGMTKLVAEKDILDAGGIVLRLATLHGYSPRLRVDLVVNEFVRKAMAGRIVVYGGRQLRPFLHVSDAADAFVQALGTASEVYNVASENMSILELAQMISDLIPCKLEVMEQIIDKRSYVVDSTKITERLSFEFKRGIKDSVEELKSALSNR